MWSYDRTVKINKLLVTVPWKTLGLYAILGQSIIIFRNREAKESICAALETIRDQNPVGRIFSSLITTKAITESSPNNGPTNSTSSSYSFPHTHRTATQSNRSGKGLNERSRQRSSRTKTTFDSSLLTASSIFRNVLDSQVVDREIHPKCANVTLTTPAPTHRVCPLL